MTPSEKLQAEANAEIATASKKLEASFSLAYAEAETSFYTETCPTCNWSGTKPLSDAGTAACPVCPTTTYLVVNFNP